MPTTTMSPPTTMPTSCTRRYRCRPVSGGASRSSEKVIRRISGYGSCSSGGDERRTLALAGAPCTVHPSARLRSIGASLLASASVAVNVCFAAYVLPPAAYASTPAADVNPFTLYGTTQKRFEVLEKDGEKILARKAGVTSRACVSILARDEEQDGAFQGLPIFEKMRGPDGTAKPSCATKEVLTSTAKSRTAKEASAAIEKSCGKACQVTCQRALDSYDSREMKRTGLGLDPDANDRASKRCVKVCTRECERPGEFSNFAVPIAK